MILQLTQPGGMNKSLKIINIISPKDIKLDGVLNSAPKNNLSRSGTDLCRCLK